MVFGELVDLGRGRFVEAGTEIAHPLFWQTNTTGNRKTPAKFIASCTSPCELAPSPK